MQRLGLVMTAPLITFVAQINRPSAGSLESSCNTGEEGFHFTGAVEVDQGKGWYGGLAVDPHCFPHISIRKSMKRGKQGYISFEELFKCMQFPALIDCLERPSA